MLLNLFAAWYYATEKKSAGLSTGGRFRRDLLVAVDGVIHRVPEDELDEYLDSLKKKAVTLIKQGKPVKKATKVTIHAENAENVIPQRIISRIRQHNLDIRHLYRKILSEIEDEELLCMMI